MDQDRERRAGFDSLEQLQAYLKVQRERFERVKATLTKERRGQLWRVLNELEAEASAWQRELAPARAARGPRARIALANRTSSPRSPRLAKAGKPAKTSPMPVITKLRKLGESPFVAIEHDSDDCAACEAARAVKWTGAGVIFFEGEDGVIRRVENLGIVWPLLFLCREVTAEEATAELQSDGAR